MTQESPFKAIVDLESPEYVNTTTVSTLAGIPLTLAENIKIGLAARLNAGIAGSAGDGKSQLLADVQSWLGNNAGYVLGRNDLDIKTLYRKLQFRKLTQAMEQGGEVSQQDLSAITEAIHLPLIIVEEINRCVEVVQNQFFNIFEGFIELDGKIYQLGTTFTKEQTGIIAVRYSVGLWTANFGNGDYSGTSSMDKALKERSHLIINTDNFQAGGENREDLDGILLKSKGEVRLKRQESPKDHTLEFARAFAYLCEQAGKMDGRDAAYEALLFRYLKRGLDYIPVDSAKNSKRVMAEVWPAKAEEDNIGGTEEEKLLYRVVSPASTRSALTILQLARSMREYVRAKDPNAQPEVVESVIEAFKLVAPYSGIIKNPQRVREDFVGNDYLAAQAVAGIIKKKMEDNKDLLDAIAHYKAQGQPLPRTVLDECKHDLDCLQ